MPLKAVQPNDNIAVEDTLENGQVVRLNARPLDEPVTTSDGTTYEYAAWHPSKNRYVLVEFPDE